MPSHKDFDAITQQLAALQAKLPSPRRLNLQEKLALIKDIGGPRTVQTIIKASHTLPIARIPFLFNSLDCQLVVDILANDMSDALETATTKKTPPPK